MSSNECDGPGHPPLRISSLLGRREPTRLSNQPHPSCKCLAVNSFSSYTARMDSGVEPQTSKRYKTQADGVSNWLEEQWASLLVAVAFIFYAARLFRLISRYAVNIFFSDQWEFNDATLFQKHSLWQIFDWQHGPHRQGLGALFEKLVDPIFGWNSRIESFIVWGVIVTAAICALWLKRRLYGSFSVFDVVIPAILFIPAQWETLFVTANFSHGPFPLLLILVYCLSWTFGKRAVRYPLVLLINFAGIYTGFGIFLGVLTPILLALDYWASAPQTRLRRTYFVWILLVAIVSLASFFVGYKFNADLECFSFQPQTPRSYVAYVALMFANFFAIRRLLAFPRIVGTMILAASLVSLAIALGWLLRRQGPKCAGEEGNRALLTVGLTAYSLLLCVGTAYGRLCGGLLTAFSPRYAIYLEPAVLGFYFFLLGLHQDRTRKLLLSGFLMAIVAASSHVDRSGMAYFRDAKQRWKTCYLQTEDIKHCDKVAGFPIYTHPPERTHLQEKLQYLKTAGQNLYSDSR